MDVRLYYDLGSPYAYLSFERASALFGAKPRLEPVLVGGIFVLRGHGSWSQTPDRDGRMTEVEARAERYGLGPIRWPRDWPDNTLAAMRATVWAEERGEQLVFARAAFRAAFAEGRDLSDLGVLVEIADSVGLPGADLPAAVGQNEVKDALKERTDAAWGRGVIGVPCVEVEGKVFYGDDQLEFALERARPAA